MSGSVTLMETVLITGGAGFIGSNIADALAARGCRVVVLDDLSTGRLHNIDHLLHAPNFTFIRGSILDGGLLRSVMKSYQVSSICHHAAIVSETRSILDPVKTVETNIAGTANLFDIAAESCCRRLVLASSCAVYGDRAEAPRKEAAPLKPRSPYAVSKAAQEMLARSFCSLHNIEIVGLRYVPVYGRRQNPDSDYAAIIPAIISKAIKNEPVAIEGDGLEAADFVYIDDVVRANLLALSARNISGKCVNIGSGVNATVLDLAGMIIRSAGSSSKVVHKPARPGSARRHSLADIEKAKIILGYTPGFSIDQGLHETVKWFQGR